MTTTATAPSETTDKAFEILVRQHHRRILAYALAMTPRHDLAEDMVQEAFLAAHRQLGEFDMDRDFGSWVRGIVRHKFHEHWRRNREAPVDPQRLQAVDRDHKLWDAHESNPGEAFAALRQCLGKLPEMFRRPVQLFYLERKSGTETAHELDTPEATVRKRLQRARGKLAACVTRALQAQEA